MKIFEIYIISHLHRLYEKVLHSSTTFSSVQTQQHHIIIFLDYFGHFHYLRVKILATFWPSPINNGNNPTANVPIWRILRSQPYYNIYSTFFRHYQIFNLYLYNLMNLKKGSKDLTDWVLNYAKLFLMLYWPQWICFLPNIKHWKETNTYLQNSKMMQLKM